MAPNDLTLDDALGPACSGEPVRALGLDGDDTLWHSESEFEATHARFREIVARYTDVPTEALDERLLAIEVANLPVFGYGVKGFTLSMVETAIEVTERRIPATAIAEIVEIGKTMMAHPVTLIDDVAATVERLARDHHLILVTKGDLFHQESKVARSGLADLFHQIEIVSEKDEATYERVLRAAGVPPAQFMMVGNSLRSDVMPVLALGGRAVHIPYRITWAHEVPPPDREVPSGFFRLDRLSELPELLETLGNGMKGGTTR